MEDEKRVFGEIAGDSDDFDLEEKFDLYHKNKEYSKNNIDNSSKDLTDYFELVSQNVPEPSQEEVDKGIEKILKIIHPDEEKSEEVKTNKSKKVTTKVLFLVALLSIVLFSCLCVVGNSHNISIENGFMSFAKDTVKIVFFGEDEEEYITVDALLADLEQHGYKDIMFPQEFVANSDEYKVSVPEYSESEFLKQFSFNIHNDNTTYYLSACSCDELQLTYNYVDLKNVETINSDGVDIYAFEFDSGFTQIEFIYDGYRYHINANISYFDMVGLAKTIK